MPFYEPVSSLHTNLLNNPFLTNSINSLNEHYLDNLDSMSYSNISSIYENLEEQHLCSPWCYSDFLQVESPYPDLSFRTPHNMEYSQNSTSPVIKSECIEDIHVNSLVGHQDIYLNSNIENAPSSPKSVASSSSSSHSTSSESKKRVHQCPYCVRSFVRKHDLIRHKRIHTGIKPYQCPCCLKGFSRSDARQQHFRREAACRDGAEKLPRRRK
jgi:uncharacterized Zn-finger protein